MMRIPFTKAHGDHNDFLLTWAGDAPREKQAEAAIAICERHTGAGADGWLLVSPAPKGADYTASIRLFNPDGGEVEMSGNGTRCAAAFLLDSGFAGDELVIITGGGRKHLRVLERKGLLFEFDMNMGAPSYASDEVRYALELKNGTVDATILNVGNPQCAVFSADAWENWRALGPEIEWHPKFPKRTNVSFIRVMDEHNIEVRFFERGAGETMSSGTGSTGAAVSSVLRGLVKTPVKVHTPAGVLDFRWDGTDAYLTGPAEIVAAGEFYWRGV